MKSHIKAILLVLLLCTATCFGQGTIIDIINNSQDWLLIFRVGDPNTTITVQKRWDQSIILPLVAGASDAMQAIEIAREGTSITNSETSFSGFNGNTAQNCTITVQPSSISISYASGSGGAATNQTSPTNNNSPGNAITAATDGGSGGSGGGGWYGGNNGYHTPNTGDNNSPTNHPDSATGIPKPAPPKKNVLAGASGVRVKITPSDTSKMPPLEAPSPLNVRYRPGLESIPTLSTLPPEPLKRRQTGYYVVFAAILAAIVVFIVSRIRERRANTSRMNSRRM